jgi:hypothetical protein
MSLFGYGKMFIRPDECFTKPVPTPAEFTRVVETLVRRYDLSYLEAIAAICDHYDREYESVKKLLTSKIKTALMEELAQKRMLKDNSFLQDKLG